MMSAAAEWPISEQEPEPGIKHEFTIEDSIPIPKRRSRGRIYPFKDMKIGQSFELIAEDRAKAYSCLFWASRVYAKNHGVKFVIRSTEKGARIWRIESEEETAAREAAQ